MSYFPELPESDLPEKKQRPHGCLIALTAVVIIALLGSALVSVAWFVLREQDEPEQPIVEPIAEATQTTAPNPTQTDTADFPTAVATENAETSDSINRIAFVNNEGQIVTIGADGNDPRLLTEGDELYRFPAWSPSGDQIAAIGTTNLGSSVMVMQDAANSQNERLYFGARKAPFYLYWSPDSETVSFLANDPQGMGLHLAAADGSSDSRLRSVGGPLYWQWSADSQQIMIHSGFSGPDSRLELIEAAGEEQGEQIADPGYFQAPGMSADGRLWVYAEAFDEIDSQVVVADTSSGGNQTQQHTGQTAMSLSPAENYLAFISPESPGSTDFVGPLKLMNVETGEVDILNRDPVIAFFWSPNGRYLAAIIPGNFRGDDINAASFSFEKEKTSKPSVQFNLPTLDLIIFDVETKEGTNLLSFTPTISFLTQMVPFFDQYALSHRIWSPTSDALVMPILEDGRSQIYIIPTNGGKKRLLAPGSMAFWSHQ